MKKIISLLAFTSILFINTAQAEGDIENGRALALNHTCTNSSCHGPDGMSIEELVPKLAGQQEAYMVQQLENYQSGDRKDSTPMKDIIAPLSAQDIQDLAAYFASNSAVASYSFETQALSIPYVEVGDTIYDVEMGLDDTDNLIFSVTRLDER